jgi:hypothetical protein
MRINVESTKLFSLRAAMLGLMVAACFPLMSAYAQTAPSISAISYVNATTLSIGGSNFGSTPGTISVGGGLLPVLNWSDGGVHAAVTLCAGGDYSQCTSPGISYVVTVTTSTGQSATATWATLDTKLPSTVTDTYMTITHVQINGGGSTAHVAPGATFTISGSFNILDNSCPDCSDSVVVGLQTGATPSCLFHGVEGPAPGFTGAGSTKLTAPTSNGVYNIVAHVGQNGCHTWDYGVPGNAFVIGAIAVY